MSRLSFALALFTFVLSGCGGGGGASAGGAPTSQGFSGVAVDGYLFNARAFLDLNGNGTYDVGEPTSLTGTDGSFNLSATQDQINSHSVIVQAISGTTIDQDNPNTPLSAGFTMIAPAGYPSVVSPLTTQVAAKMASGLSIDSAKSAVQSELGLTSIDVMKNFVAEKTTNSAYVDAHKIAVSIAEVLKSIDSVSGSSTTLAAKMAAVISQVASQVTVNIESIKQANSIDEAKQIFQNVNQASNIYRVGGSISGLRTSGLSLSNGLTTLQISSNSTVFNFPHKQAANSQYAVSIVSNPDGQTCFLTNAIGSITDRSITSVAISCIFTPATLSGTVGGLNTSGLKIRNGNEEISIGSSDSTFSFANRISIDSAYSVQISSQPIGQICSIGNPDGSMVSGGVNSIRIVCANRAYLIGGSISGLTRPGLRLKNGSEILEVSTNSTKFTLPSTVAFGSNYKIEVVENPPGLTCVVSSSEGVMGANDISSAQIECDDNFYAISGEVSGSTNEAVVSNYVFSVVIDGSHKGFVSIPVGRALSTNRSFTVPYLVRHGSSVQLIPHLQPEGGSCLISDINAVITRARNDLSVTCIPTAVVKLTAASEKTFTGNQIKLDASQSIGADNSQLTYTWNNNISTGSVPIYYITRDQSRMVNNIGFVYEGRVAVQSSSGAYGGNNHITLKFSDPVTRTFMGVAGDCRTVDGNLQQARSLGAQAIFVDKKGNIYFSEANMIRKIDLSGNVLTVAGSVEMGNSNGFKSEARFFAPKSLVVDSSGVIFVYDANNLIRKIDLNGNVSFFSGSGVIGSLDGTPLNAQFSGAGQLAIDDNDIIYMSDTYNHRIRKIGRDGFVSTLTGESQGYANGIKAIARFDTPGAISVDSLGNLIVAEYGVTSEFLGSFTLTTGFNIRRVTRDGSVDTISRETVAQTTGRFYSSVAVDENDNIYKINPHKNSIYFGNHILGSNLYGTNGAGYNDSVNQNLVLFNEPTALAWSKIHGLLVADTRNCVIRTIKPSD